MHQYNMDIPVYMLADVVIYSDCKHAFGLKCLQSNLIVRNLSQNILAKQIHICLKQKLSFSHSG